MTITRPPIKQPIPPHGKKVFDGVVFDVYQWQQEMYDGSIKTFEKLKRRDSVVCIPVTNSGKILVTYEEQPGKGSFINLPGGQVEDGESVETACSRELLEETGYSSENLVEWFSLQVTSKIDYVQFYLIAKNCVQNSQPKLGSGEKIETKEVNFDEFYEIVLNLKFADKELKLELLLAEKQGRLNEIKTLLGVE